MMKQWIDKLLNHYWKTSYGQIYPTMKKFLKEGLVTVENIQNDNGVNCKYYYITDKGLDLLKEWLLEDTPDFNSRDESLLKYKFSSLLPINTVILKAERSLMQLETTLKGYSDHISYMESVNNPTRAQLMTYLATKKGIYLNEARIKWTKECIQTLKDFDKGVK